MIKKEHIIHLLFWKHKLILINSNLINSLIIIIFKYNYSFNKLNILHYHYLYFRTLPVRNTNYSLVFKKESTLNNLLDNECCIKREVVFY